MLTKQTFDACKFQFLSWLPTEYSVDKWHNTWIFGSGRNFRPGSVYSGICLLTIRVLSRKWLLIGEVANKGT